MKIAMIGSGYVGLVSGTCFAQMGHHVHCIDIDEQKVQRMKQGECPIYEPGLEDLMHKALEKSFLSFSASYSDIAAAQVVFLAVGTPESADGSANLSYLYQAIDQCLEVFRQHPEQKNRVFVIKSTVPVGTGLAIKNHLIAKGFGEIAVINNPEFLKEGSAVDDFMKPERIILGGSILETDQWAFEVLDEVYAPFSRQNYRIIKMSNVSAEMTKYAANCFLATKITFMNEIARLCDVLGANVNEVRAGIATDSRIGSQFLYPGPGYGGSCFPKDVKALAHTARQNDEPFEIIETVEKVNQKQKHYVLEKMDQFFGGRDGLNGKNLCLWGLAFKANTDDVRESSSLVVAAELLKAGVSHLQVHDPEASENFMHSLKEFLKVNGVNEDLISRVKVHSDEYAALEAADALAVLTEWTQYRSPDFARIKQLLRTDVIFDARNLYKRSRVEAEQMTYFGIGC